MAQVVYAVGRSVAPPRARAVHDLAYWAFAFQIFALVFLQKLAVPFGPLSVSLPMVTLFAWLGVMVIRNQLHVSLFRLGMAALFFTAVIVSQLFVDAPVSLPSFLQLVLLYAPFVFIWRVSPETHARLLNLFQNAMLVGAAMVFVQLASQVALGFGNSPNMETYLPHSLLLAGYNYAAPISWGKTFVRPNGFFFLEPSFVSSFLATALIIELMWFRRVWRVLLYAAALLGTLAATGILLALLAAPLLIARQNIRAAIFTAFAGLVAAAAAFSTGAVDQLSGRVSELGSPGSSGWQRLIAPLLQLRSVYSDAESVFTGVGAGNSIETNVSLWPIVKVMVEYGALAGLLFFAFMVICMAKSANKPLAFGLFVIFNFTGGFLLMPITVIQILLLVCMLQPVGPARSRAPRMRRPPRAAIVRPARPAVQGASPSAGLGAAPHEAPASTQ